MEQRTLGGRGGQEWRGGDRWGRVKERICGAQVRQVWSEGDVMCSTGVGRGRCYAITGGVP